MDCTWYKQKNEDEKTSKQKRKHPILTKQKADGYTMINAATIKRSKLILH